MTNRHKPTHSIRKIFIVIFLISIVLEAIGLIMVGMFMRNQREMTANITRNTRSIIYAQQLNDGSDQLTMNSRNYVTDPDGHLDYMLEYWKVIHVETLHADAVIKIKSLGLTEKENDAIDSLFLSSNNLMDTEELSMRLMLKGIGVETAEQCIEELQEYGNDPKYSWLYEEVKPDAATFNYSGELIIENITATLFRPEIDALLEQCALDVQEKGISLDTLEGCRSAAISLVFSDTYSRHRSWIRDNIGVFCTGLNDHMSDDLDASVQHSTTILILTAVLLVSFLVFIFVTMDVLYKMLIKPILDINASIGANENLQEYQVTELQALSDSYNESKTDLTESKKELALQAKIYAEKSRRDYLTQLANREMLDEYLVGMFSGEPVAFVQYMIDIDNFKIVNDTYGHVAGDEVLKELAKVFKEIGRKYDGIAARYGGEEFVICATGITEEDINPIAEEILEAVRALKVSYEGTSISITVSVGSCYSLLSGRDATTIVQNADGAMYKSKATGKNCHSRYKYIIAV